MTTTEYTDHHGPEGLLVRGTVVVVPGRGESRATYERFGSRLAADAYRVRVVDPPALDAAGLPGALDRFGAALTAAADGTAPDGGDGVAGPLVLAGADTGALAIAALLGRPESEGAPRPDAVVLAGLPGPGRTAATAEGSWEDELDVRTSCPTHRARLTDDTRFHRGALAGAVDGTLLTAAYQSELAVPALLLTGDADPLADRAALDRAAKSWPRARLAVVRGGHHDVLNDLQHRSVAAEVVTFLETLRNGLLPVVTVESSAW
ncbi:serine aminopeptidase domain-containing protein [Streptomyces sp. NPDC008092]|uniref:alpha/beta hydrolase n=1 Tax=Streptomyces sp. NPDC008092 TaxID=3364808 RepID=UPI0036E8F050